MRRAEAFTGRQAFIGRVAMRLRSGGLTCRVCPGSRHLPYVASESEIERFRQAKRRGHNVVFGDATRTGLLEAAGVAGARAIAVTFDHPPAVDRIVHFTRQWKPRARVVVSAADERLLADSVAAGTITVLPEISPQVSSSRATCWWGSIGT
jgi:voltage-gated potassium channel Kch